MHKAKHQSSLTELDNSSWTDLISNLRSSPVAYGRTFDSIVTSQSSPEVSPRSPSRKIEITPIVGSPTPQIFSLEKPTLKAMVSLQYTGSRSPKAKLTGMKRSGVKMVSAASSAERDANKLLITSMIYDLGVEVSVFV
jgi:hypothetical protein